jgi:hypothetical protein
MASAVAGARLEVSRWQYHMHTPKKAHTDILSLAEPPADGVKRRKKRNRWGDAQENKAAGLMGLPTMIMANFTNEQLEAYTLHLRIEEISQKLRINDVVPADGDRFVFLHLSSLSFFVIFY